MSSTKCNRIRAFPFRPVAESGGLTNFIEKSGCNCLLADAIKQLYALSNKPDNPIEWLRLYFKYLAEDVASECARGECDQDLNNEDLISNSTKNANATAVENMLKEELSEIEAQLMSCAEEESQNKAVVKLLENELKNEPLSSAKSYLYEDFLKYMDHNDDYHYRIRPDPLYQPSKTDLLLDEHDRKPLGQLKKESMESGESLIELVSFNPYSWMMMIDRTNTHVNGYVPLVNQGIQSKDYEDYPKIYFPDRKPPVIEEPDEITVPKVVNGRVEGEAEMLTESDMSIPSRKSLLEMNDMEYDAGSEGGESDQVKAKQKIKKERQSATPKMEKKKV